tara:strand:+ start:150 stop:374 length:225 start_codon:yes stop_codon:yes gene_type:complete
MPVLATDIPKKLEIDVIQLHKMAFIYNAVQDGWKVEIRNNRYIFSKKHEGKKEIYLDTFLERFIQKNINIDNAI